MTGPEHYAEAEHLLADADGAYPEAPEVVAAVGRAQVHATLALTAATVDMAFAAEASPAARDWHVVLHPSRVEAACPDWSMGVAHGPHDWDAPEDGPARCPGLDESAANTPDPDRSST